MLRAMDEGADLSSLRIAVSAGETLPAPVYRGMDEEDRQADPRRHRRHRDAAHLHLQPARRPRAGCDRPAGHRLRGEDRRRRHEAKCRAARSGGWPCAGRPAAATSPTTGRRNYVRDGWNLTGDSFVQDEDGRFHFAARSDDMIVSSGYNIAGPEVEAALLAHAEVARMRGDRRRRRRARPDRRGACRAGRGRRRRRR